jgi:hypothetical protein
MGMSAAELHERRPAVPFVERRSTVKAGKYHVQRMDLRSTWAVCEPPNIKNLDECDFSLEKQKPYGSARQSDNPFFGQEQRQSTFNHRSRRQGKGDDRIWALGSICESGRKMPTVPAASIEATSTGRWVNKIASKTNNRTTVGIDKVNWLTPRAGPTWGVEL